MSLPETVTMDNLSGKYTMNLTLSGKSDDILSAQGVGWIKRKAIAMSTLYIDLKHNGLKGPEEKIYIEQKVGSIGGSVEDYKDFTGTPIPNAHEVYGDMFTSAKRESLSSIAAENKFLASGWIDSEFGEAGPIVIRSRNADTNKYVWEAVQVWGIRMVEVNGKPERRYARLTYFKSKSLTKELLLVYDYTGPL